MQPRIGATPKAVGQLSHQQPVIYFVFDLLYLNGYDLRAAPLSERKRLLSGILSSHPRLRHSDHYPASGKKLFEFARQHDLEGVLAKRAASRYESRRSGEWLKIKVTARQGVDRATLRTGGGVGLRKLVAKSSPTEQARRDGH